MSERRVTRLLEAGELADRGQLHGVVEAADGIVLEDMVLIEDDAPGIGMPEGAEGRSWFEALTAGTIARKDLLLEDARARAAWILFCGTEADDNDVSLRLRINGVELERLPSRVAHPQARHYYTADWGGSHFDNWFVVEVPVTALRAGTNEVHLWADAPGWEVMLAADSEYGRGSDTRKHHPDLSARSTDGGASWDFESLGSGHGIDGEYCVRLSLDRHCASGRYVSPVIDLAGEDGPVLSADWRMEDCHLRWDALTGKEHAVRIRVRFSHSPLLRGGGWGPWQSVDDGEGRWESAAGRFFQFEADLSTTNPLSSPLLRGLSIDCIARQDQPLSALQAARVNNGRVVRPSAPFTYEDPERLRQFRDRCALDAVIADVDSEFAAQLQLMHWAYRIPLGQLNPYSWDFRDLPRPEFDADGEPVLLGPYEGRRREGHCLFCNLTLVAACQAMGFPARWVNVSTKHTYGHEVTEVWSNDFDKWIFLDATLDYYIHDPESGIPLSLVEISERLADAVPAPATWDLPIQHHLKGGVVPVNEPGNPDAIEVQVAYHRGDDPRPVYGTEAEAHDLWFFGHLQMPLRSDFTSRHQPIPWRLTSNWGSDQFYCWYSDMFPRKREYARHTSRWQDFNPTLNQAELFLCRIEEDLIRVEIDTETPFFDAFMVRIDEGDWWSTKECTFDWPLRQGQNRVAVRVRNKSGILGPPSDADVLWQGAE